MGKEHYPLHVKRRELLANKVKTNHFYAIMDENLNFEYSSDTIDGLAWKVQRKVDQTVQLVYDPPLNSYFIRNRESRIIINYTKLSPSDREEFEQALLGIKGEKE